MYGICSQVQLTGLKSYDDKIAFTTEEGARTNIPFRVYEPITNSIHNQ